MCAAHRSAGQCGGDPISNACAAQAMQRSEHLERKPSVSTVKIPHSSKRATQFSGLPSPSRSTVSTVCAGIMILAYALPAEKGASDSVAAFPPVSQCKSFAMAIASQNVIFRRKFEGVCQIYLSLGINAPYLYKLTLTMSPLFYSIVSLLHHYHVHL